MREMAASKMKILMVVGLIFMFATEAGATNEVARGREIYLQSCATCHGIAGEGNGPMARALTTPPANLRRLSERFGNPLPEDDIARYIDGRTDVKSHGPRDMPVWGKRFSSESKGDERVAQKRIAELVAYLQSIQTAIRQASR
jgi:mono/diheme cytochrome c family protein